jgi:uncharacterized protein (DUF1501 family)
MNGGNDSHNWVVPTDATGHAEYTQARGAIALPLNELQGLSLGASQGSGRSFGMPRELAPLRALYEAGQAAVVANVGPLLQPMTKADYQAGRYLPSRLYSHNDQSSTWQSLWPEGATSGWGGRMGDLLMATNAQPVFTSISATGNAVFLSGETVQQYQVGSSGPLSIGALSKTSLAGSPTGAAALGRILADGGSNALQKEYTRLVQRSITADLSLRTGLNGVTVPALPTAPVVLPNGSSLQLDKDSLAKQLRMVAQIIGAQASMGMKRQVFMVSIGGFDTHANQLRDHPMLMARVAESVGYFQQALTGLGLAPNVTLFTASDFGRTLVSNGSGSDHGWGSHHFVVGGAVKGRNIVGAFPATALGNAQDVGSGRLLPTTSVMQYAATLGRWMGLSDSELLEVLPGLNRFSARTLGLL